MDLVVELPAASGSASSSQCGAAASGGRASSRYVALAKIGSGSFGDILAAVNEEDPNDWVALKVEARYPANDTERRRTLSSMVRFEHLVSRELARTAPCPCPKVHGRVSLSNDQDVLAMELLGPNLKEYATILGQWPLPQDLVLLIGASLVGRLEQLHACGFVHRDLKPENFLLRLDPLPDEGPVPCLLLVDFAMASRFAQAGGQGHVPQRRETETPGTHRYMAIAAQRGTTQSRRTDLESLAYVLIYLAQGQLPWQNQPDVERMLAQKEATSLAELCNQLQPAFAHFLSRCRELHFDEAPQYEVLQQMLLRGVQGPTVDFQAARVRRAFRQELQEAYFRKEAAQSACAPRARRAAEAPLAALPAMLPVFVRHEKDSTELVVRRPSCAADLDDRRCFFFEGYSEGLPGMVHVVVGACHFFGFLKLEYLTEAHAEAGLSYKNAEQLLVFSVGKRDWVVRAISLTDYNVSTGKMYKEWSLRCAFWARVVLAWNPT